MKKLFLRSIFSIIVLLIVTPNIGNAYEPYTDFFPSIGSTQYLGNVKLLGEDPISIYIADDDTINTMIYYRYYTNTDRKWTVKVLLVPTTERTRQAFVSIVNEGARNDTWAINNHLSLPINNKIWSLRKDVSYSPNERTISITGGWAYNTEGEMLGMDKQALQKTKTFSYGEDETFSNICDLVSVFMAERYQNAVLNSQDFTR